MRHHLFLSLAAVAASLPQANASVFSGDLLAARTFAVLGASTVTSTGNTVLIGNLGVYPGSAITGFPPGFVSGLTYDNAEAVVQQAQIDALAAFVALSNETPVENLTGLDLGGLTLSPGVRNFTSSAQLTGTLTLDGGGDPHARFDFLIGSTLTTSVGSAIVLINGADADNVFWKVGSSATLGSDTAFWGNIIAQASITMNARASLAGGRAFALNGAVTLDDNDITAGFAAPGAVPEARSFLPLALCFPVLGVWQWRAARRRKAARGC